MYAATEKTSGVGITVTTKVNSSPLSWLAPKTEAEKKIISDNMKERQQRIGMDNFPIYLFNLMIDEMCRNGRWRDVMYLVCQANWGLRCGDTMNIKVQDLFYLDCTFRDRFYLIEEKTKDTRKNKTTRLCVNNEAVKMAVTLYLANNKDRRMYDYLFVSESNHKEYVNINGLYIQKPLTHTTLESIIKDTIESFGIRLVNGTIGNKAEEGLKLNTHSLRKTFGEIFKETSNQMLKEGEIVAEDRAFEMAQLAFGHSSAKITQRYVGAVDEIIYEVVNRMNIGKEILEKYYRKAVENNE